MTDDIINWAKKGDPEKSVEFAKTQMKKLGYSFVTPIYIYPDDTVYFQYKKCAPTSEAERHPEVINANAPFTGWSA